MKGKVKKKVGKNRVQKKEKGKKKKWQCGPLHTRGSGRGATRVRGRGDTKTKIRVRKKRMSGSRETRAHGGRWIRRRQDEVHPRKKVFQGSRGRGGGGVSSVKAGTRGRGNPSLSGLKKTMGVF